MWCTNITKGRKGAQLLPSNLCATIQKRQATYGEFKHIHPLILKYGK